jgi:hypothetical protein
MKFELPPDKQATTNAALLRDLSRAATRLSPSPLTKTEYDRVGLFSSAGIRKRFGSWNRALSLAKVTLTKRMNIPTPELLADLRQVAERLRAKTVSREDYDREGRFSAAALRARFNGSWCAALEAAGLGLAPNSVLVGDDEAYFEIIERAWQRLGRPPRRDEIRRPECAINGRSIAKRFGSWRRALEQFVAAANSGATSAGLSKPRKERDAGGEKRSCAPKRSTPREPSWRLRFLVLSRDGFRCCACGASPALTPGVKLEVDHKLAWANGGQTTMDNLVTLCQQCNGGKSALRTASPK